MIGVTSFSREGYEQYGKNFLESIDNWPGKIIVYLESPIDFEHHKLEKRDFFDIPNASRFLTNIEQIPESKGMVGGGYNYNFDVNKFCRKMFCQFDAFKEGGKVFWLDADIEFIKEVSEEFLEDLFDGNPLAYLGREGMYTESGFLGFDTEHENFPGFEERYVATLQQGIFMKLPGWHDCYCFDWAKQNLGNDIVTGWEIKNKMSLEELDVIEKSPLKDVLVHRKGKRKNEIN